MYDDHLNRLLAPDTEIPWYKSIVENIRELIHPEKLPPLELTSKPVPVKDLWGRGTSPKALASSVLVQAMRSSRSCCCSAPAPKCRRRSRTSS